MYQINLIYGHQLIHQGNSREHYAQGCLIRGSFFRQSGTESWCFEHINVEDDEDGFLRACSTSIVLRCRGTTTMVVPGCWDVATRSIKGSHISQKQWFILWLHGGLLFAKIDRHLWFKQARVHVHELPWWFFGHLAMNWVAVLVLGWVYPTDHQGSRMRDRVSFVMDLVWFTHASASWILYKSDIVREKTQCSMYGLTTDINSQSWWWSLWLMIEASELWLVVWLWVNQSFYMALTPPHGVGWPMLTNQQTACWLHRPTGGSLWV